KNTLGTCKHVLRVLDQVHEQFTAAQRARLYVRTRASLALHYGDQVELRLALPAKSESGLEPAVARVLAPFAGRKITRLRRLLAALGQAEQLGHPVKVYPDAEQYLEQQLVQERLTRVTRLMRARPAAHPLRRE